MAQADIIINILSKSSSTSWNRALSSVRFYRAWPLLKSFLCRKQSLTAGVSFLTRNQDTCDLLSRVRDNKQPHAKKKTKTARQRPRTAPAVRGTVSPHSPVSKYCLSYRSTQVHDSFYIKMWAKVSRYNRWVDTLQQVSQRVKVKAAGNTCYWTNEKELTWRLC